jgi:AcrR family transcriptional regulator
MPKMNLSSGRINQKTKTRNDLLRAADSILKRGEKPTVDNIAKEALTSRATVYRYFPNLEKLLLEAPLEIKTKSPNKLFKNAKNDSAESRVSKVQEYLFDLSKENEAQFRLFIKSTMSEWLEHEGNVKEGIRGGRRIKMLEEALAPIKDSISSNEFNNLRDALAVMVGIESLIVTQDVCQISHKKGKEALNWAARQLVKSVLIDK